MWTRPGSARFGTERRGEGAVQQRTARCSRVRGRGEGQTWLGDDRKHQEAAGGHVQLLQLHSMHDAT